MSNEAGAVIEIILSPELFGSQQKQKAVTTQHGHCTRHSALVDGWRRIAERLPKPITQVSYLNYWQLPLIYEADRVCSGFGAEGDLEIQRKQVEDRIDPNPLVKAGILALDLKRTRLIR